ncbi:MAG: UDPGP type 1 family protein [Deltaproteobacteria bacterium]|nr:UDPGP type 1 family protein [Deltaproteobacteria bacterium]
MNRDTIINLLVEYKQQRMLRCLELLDPFAQDALLRELSALDFREIASLYHNYKYAAGQTEKIFQEAELVSPGSAACPSAECARLEGLGRQALQDGRVALYLVAGGQGSRLGFDGPKGCFPVSPLKSKTLFQLFAEQVLALQQRYGVRLPWYILTSQENNPATLDFFKDHDFFGLHTEDVRCIVQNQIPSLGLDGQLLVGKDSLLFKNPNGHGGSLYALQDSGALADMSARGIDEIFFFQVDNPLVKIADPLFLGAHIDRRAQMSTKVVRKTDPGEKVGIIGRVNGRLGCIEYSELTPEQTAEKLPDGSLRFKSANIAVHMLSRAFVEKLVSRADFHLPYHSAVKNITCLDACDGRLVEQSVQGIKFEMFIFDALGFAERSVTLEVPREEEFSPVKNADSADSPESAQAAMLARSRSWLARALPGRDIPEDLQAEISPLFALDEQDLADKINPDSELASPLYLG